MFVIQIYFVSLYHNTKLQTIEIMSAKNITLTTEELYEFIEKETLLHMVRAAKLEMFGNQTDVEINKRNSLFGATDYKEHRGDDIDKAKEILNEILDKISFHCLLQNKNYYMNGRPFDRILYSGYRGGYRFHIGWSVSEPQKLEDAGVAWNQAMMNYF
jgi:hypothetical protein